MQLRIAPILDEFQDTIFRLPLDSQIAVLGPPGTGKTTTLVRRLRQKIDFAYLDADSERPLVEGLDAAGLTHADSWIMFSPTELLRLYVKDAFGKEGVPVHDESLRTWDDYRREIGRRNLNVLRSGGGSGFVLREDDSLLSPTTLINQIAWFEAFDRWQKEDFIHQLEVATAQLHNAPSGDAVALGRQASEAIARSRSNPLLLLGELAGLRNRLRQVADAQRDDTKTELRKPLGTYAQADSGFLEALTHFVANLDNRESEGDDEEDLEIEEEEEFERTQPLRGRRLVEDVFVRAMRSRAISQASGRNLSGGSRAGRLLAWLDERDLPLPELRQVGDALLVQRAAIQLSRAANDYLTKIPQRYRRFRRSTREQNTWYGEGKLSALDAHPAEVDLILLAMFRAARNMEDSPLLSRRITENKPALLETIIRLRRNQILVDEATDFSPVQLACMRAMASTNVDSFFAAGDFNQRLTRWGSRSEQELLWVSPNLNIEHINVTYRQSRRLSEFARALGELYGYQLFDRPSEDIDNVGVAPVLGTALDSLHKEVSWLSARIAEINNFTDSAMPTIAVLVSDPAALEPLADALSKELQSMNIKAVACPKGMVKGQNGDVRIFEVEHIKGLEFEAVFFMNIDNLREREPELFDRYIYVGATRAATFLGLSCHGPELPQSLSTLETLLTDRW